MGLLTSIGELIKAFSVPQQEIEGQDEEDITVDKLAKIAEQSGTKPENIEELTRGYQKQESSAEKFRREQAEALQQSEDAETKSKSKSTELRKEVQEKTNKGEGKQSPTRNQGIEQEL